MNVSRSASAFCSSAATVSYSFFFVKIRDDAEAWLVDVTATEGRVPEVDEGRSMFQLGNVEEKHVITMRSPFLCSFFIVFQMKM